MKSCWVTFRMMPSASHLSSFSFVAFFIRRGMNWGGTFIGLKDGSVSMWTLKFGTQPVLSSKSSGKRRLICSRLSDGLWIVPIWRRFLLKKRCIFVLKILLKSTLKSFKVSKQRMLSIILSVFKTITVIFRCWPFQVANVLNSPAVSSALLLYDTSVHETGLRTAAWPWTFYSTLSKWWRLLARLYLAWIRLDRCFPNKWCLSGTVFLPENQLFWFGRYTLLMSGWCHHWRWSCLGWHWWCWCF